MTYEIPYTGNLKWLVPNTILYVVHGSRAYGTHRPDSDYDYKGVAVAPREYRDGYLKTFEQAIWKEPEDATIFNVQKFFKLAADCNPNIIEVLWVSDESRLLVTPQGQKLVDARELFLSRKAVHTFRGYAMAQLKRIRTHRKWLLQKPEKPTRQQFGLPEYTVIPKDQLAAANAQIKKKLDSWQIDFGDMDEATKIYIQEQMSKYLAEVHVGSDEHFAAASRLLGYNENFLAYLDQEKRYKAAMDSYKNFLVWQTDRNRARYDLEALYGYDTKHAMHLVRLLRMCREILTEGVVHVMRPDAKDLLAVRNGEWDYDRLIEWAQEQDVELLEIAESSPLPHSPPHNKLDALCMEIVQSFD